MSEYIQNGTSLYKKVEPNKRVDYKTDIDEFEFKRTPENDEMLKQLCLRAIKLASNIVRCKDCKYWEVDNDVGFCTRTEDCDWNADDFCSRGERAE